MLGMNTLDKISNKKSLDPFDKLIFEHKLRAKDLIIHQDLDLMILIFNNGKIVKFNISDFPKLKAAKKKQLNDYRFIGGGVGIRWEELDEDLSIKGIIKTAALNAILRDLQVNGSSEKFVA